MREEKTKVIPQQVIEQWTTHYIEYHCDRCGRLISKDDHLDGYAHELAIAMDSDECVNFYRRRDYCPACLTPVWEAINKLIGADPDEERDREYE